MSFCVSLEESRRTATSWMCIGHEVSSVACLMCRTKRTARLLSVDRAHLEGTERERLQYGSLGFKFETTKRI